MDKELSQSDNFAHTEDHMKQETQNEVEVEELVQKDEEQSNELFELNDHQDSTEVKKEDDLGSRKRPLEEDENDNSEQETTTENKIEGSDKYHGLAKLLTMMEDYRPVIPDAVTDYYLMKSGFECSDVRIKRLLALSAQRFISNIAEGAMQYYLMHLKGPESKDKKSLMKNKVKVLEMDDLSLSLADHGINVKKQEYYL